MTTKPATLAIILTMLCGCDKHPKTIQQEKPTMMTEWNKSIIAFHNLDYADDPDSLVLGSPASAASIAEFEKAIGYSMPEEFKTLYSEYDGFGTTGEGEVDWFFLPLAKLPALASEVRDSFHETHPQIAKRFVPFADWGNGDASGYLFSESGVPELGIFIFEHESYNFEENQDWREFLFPVDESIHDFLNE